MWGKSPERIKEDSDIESEKEEVLPTPADQDKKRKKSKKDKKKKKKKKKHKKKKKQSSSSDESSSEDEWVEKDVLEVSLHSSVVDTDPTWIRTYSGPLYIRNQTGKHRKNERQKV